MSLISVSFCISFFVPYVINTNNKYFILFVLLTQNDNQYFARIIIEIFYTCLNMPHRVLPSNWTYLFIFVYFVLDANDVQWNRYKRCGREYIWNVVNHFNEVFIVYLKHSFFMEMPLTDECSRYSIRIHILDTEAVERSEECILHWCFFFCYYDFG